MSEWLRIYEHELSRRRRVAADDPSLYKKVHACNPKGLLYKDKCSGHCWVPATHLMIHDGGSRPIKIGGVIRRAFIEAKTYKIDGYTVVPQMCWNCDAHRERRIERVTTGEREKKLRAERPRKLRGRRPAQQVESIFDD